MMTTTKMTLIPKMTAMPKMTMIDLGLVPEADMSVRARFSRYRGDSMPIERLGSDR